MCGGGGGGVQGDCRVTAGTVCVEGGGGLQVLCVGGGLQSDCTYSVCVGGGGGVTAG